MFAVFKLAAAFVSPPLLIFLGLSGAVILLWRQRLLWGRYLLVLTLIFYYLLAIPPVAYVLTVALEEDFTPVNLAGALENTSVIVVLAGGANGPTKGHSFAELSGASWRRWWRGIELYRQFEGRLPLLYSGGSGDPFHPFTGEAALARSYAVASGVVEDHVWIESDSRTTWESAFAVKSFLDERFPEREQHRVILVTSARHMPRSLAMMRRVGIEALPAPADFSAADWRWSLASFLPNADSFSSSVASLHEWLGLAAYSIWDSVKI